MKRGTEDCLRLKIEYLEVGDVIVRYRQLRKRQKVVEWVVKSIDTENGQIICESVDGRMRRQMDERCIMKNWINSGNDLVKAIKLNE